MTTKKLTILVDMDSIISDFLGGVLDLYEEDTGVRLAPEAVTTWDFVFPNGKTIYDYFKAPGFFRALKPIPFASVGLKTLMDAGHDVLIVSNATLTYSPTEKYQWLEEHLPFFARKNVIFAARKEFVAGDVLIDDFPKNVEEHHARNPNTVYLTLKYGYNEGCELYDLRTDSWLEILSYVAAL